ncbi:MAG: phosphopantetheine-binding protein [Pseudomonadales bacterium]
MSDQTSAEAKLARILVDVLDIEDVAPEDIVPEAPLFDPEDERSLGLDSIDALEISLAIAKEYQVQLEADNEDNKKIFFSLRSLSDYVIENSPT